MRRSRVGLPLPGPTHGAGTTGELAPAPSQYVRRLGMMRVVIQPAGMSPAEEKWLQQRREEAWRTEGQPIHAKLTCSWGREDSDGRLQVMTSLAGCKRLQMPRQMAETSRRPRSGATKRTELGMSFRSSLELGGRGREHGVICSS